MIGDTDDVIVNNIGDDGAVALAQMIETNRTITSINLSGDFMMSSFSPKNFESSKNLIKFTKIE